jgi:hypothetical protein
LTYLILNIYHCDISFCGRRPPVSPIREASHEEKAMNARTPLRSRTQRNKKAIPAATADLGEQVRIRQLEKSVSWTGRERLWFLWYRLRLTVQEMNSATRRLTELQARLP